MKKLKNITKSGFSFTELEKKIEPKSLYTLIFIESLSTLFFIQALRSYVPGIYVSMFHVVFRENIGENLLVLITLIFFFLPALTNTICKKIDKNRIMIYSIYVIAIFRLLIAFHLSNTLQTIFSGVIITSYGFFMSVFLAQWMENYNQIESNDKIIIVVFGILFAFLVDYLIRTIGFTEDVTLLPPGLIADFWYITQYIWLVVQVPLTIISIYLARKNFLKFSPSPEINKGENEVLSSKYLLIFAGIGMFLFLQFNLFLYPNIIVRYTNTNYYFNNFLNIISLIIAFAIVSRINRIFLSNFKIIGILNLFMISSLVLFLFLGTIPILNYIISVCVSISIIVMYLDFFLLFARMSTVVFKWEKVKTISNAITISFAFFLLFTVFHIFTTDWAYVISAFKGFGPIIVLLAGGILFISTIASITIKSQEGVQKKNE